MLSVHVQFGDCSSERSGMVETKAAVLVAKSHSTRSSFAWSLEFRAVCRRSAR